METLTSNDPCSSVEVERWLRKEVHTTQMRCGEGRRKPRKHADIGARNAWTIS